MVLTNDKCIAFVNEALLAQFQAVKARYHLPEFPDCRDQLEGISLTECFHSESTALSRLRLDSAHSYLLDLGIFSLRFNVSPLPDGAVACLDVLHGKFAFVERICNASADMRQEKSVFTHALTLKGAEGTIVNLIHTLLGHTYNHLSILGRHLVVLHDMPLDEPSQACLERECADAYTQICDALVYLMESHQRVVISLLSGEEASLTSGQIEALQGHANKTGNLSRQLRSALDEVYQTLSHDMHSSQQTRQEATQLGDVSEQGRMLALLTQFDAAKAGEDARYLAKASEDVMEVTEQGSIASSEVLTLTHNSHSRLASSSDLLAQITHKTEAIHKRLLDIERLALKLQEKHPKTSNDNTVMMPFPVDEARKAQRIRAALDYTSNRLNQREDL